MRYPVSVATTLAPTHLTTTPPRPSRVDVGLQVDETLTGKPTSVDRSFVYASTRFDLDAPAGARLVVDVPEGVELNPHAYINDARGNITFARDGASWVATATQPIQRVTLDTNAAAGRGALTASGTNLRVGDVLARLSVDGVKQEGPLPQISVTAPLGWQTSSSDGTPDAAKTIDGYPRLVTARRDGDHGAETIATFTGRDPDGRSTTGLGRLTGEVGSRVGNVGGMAAYIALMLAGGRRS